MRWVHMSLASRLKAARESKGMSQLYVSDRIKVGNKSISDWERGISEPDAESIGKLAALYGVTTDYLLGLSESKKNELTSDDFTIAFSGLSEELTEEQKKQLLDIANAFAATNNIKKN